MFKDIKGFEGRYLVNAQGEIYSCPKKQSEGKGFLHNGKKLKPYKNKHGYLMVVLYGEKKHRLTIHRIVCQTFVENVENKKYVNLLLTESEKRVLSHLSVIPKSIVQIYEDLNRNIEDLETIISIAMLMSDLINLCEKGLVLQKSLNMYVLCEK